MHDHASTHVNKKTNANYTHLTPKCLALLLCVVIASPVGALERIQGTQIFMNAPDGFTQATQFPGYIMASTRSSIVINVIPGPFLEVMKGLDGAALAPKGITLLTTEPAKVGSLDGFLIQAGQWDNDVPYLKWVLAFGNKKESVLIIATFPEHLEETLSGSLKDTILAAQWNTNLPVSLLEGLTFRVSEAGDLKIAKKMGNNILLTKDGIFPAEEQGAPFVVVGSSLHQDTQITTDKKTFANQRLQYTEVLRDPKVQTERALELGGMEAYLIDAIGTDHYTGEKLFIRQCLVFSEEGYYLFQAMVADKRRQEYDAVFAMILNSFETI